MRWGSLPNCTVFHRETRAGRQPGRLGGDHLAMGTGATPPCSLMKERDCHVAILWGSIAMVGVYLPPYRNRARFEERLDSLSVCIKRLGPQPTLDRRGFQFLVDDLGFSADQGRGRDPGGLGGDSRPHIA